MRALLEAGLAHHRAGRLNRAEALYRKALAARPNEPDALHLLGLIALQQGHPDLAEQRVRHAIEGRAEAPSEFHDTLANALVCQGRTEEALAHFRQALALRDDLPLTHRSLGGALCSLGRPGEAVPHFEAAVRLNPTDAASQSNLGTVFLDRRIFAEAVPYFEKALDLDPNCAEAWCNLGHALSELGRHEEGAVCLEKALVLRPTMAAAFDNLGCLRHRQGRLMDAMLCYDRAMGIEPTNAQVYNNLGNIFKDQMCLDDAMVCYDKAIELRPGFYDAWWNRALVRFMQGDIARGWAEYEWGWLAGRRIPQREFPQPWWDGSPLSGRRLLFWGEQGIGDEMIFAGMVPDLIAAGASCIVECEPRLVPLFARSFPDADVIPRTLPPHPAVAAAEIQIPAGSAARFLRGSLDQFPRAFSGSPGYLRADPARVAFWRERLAQRCPRLRVGICWRSSLAGGLRATQCSSLAEWKAILTTPGVDFVNLQYDDCRAELTEAGGEYGVVIHSWPDIDLKQELDEVAALMSALDLVVSVGTSVACMAGALGIPVWQLTWAGAGDCWTMGRDYCPWFPSMRLYERAWDRTWKEVAESLARDLTAKAEAHRRPDAVAVS